MTREQSPPEPRLKPVELADNEVTSLLLAWRGGDSDALDRLMPLVYAELRRLAGGYLRRERVNHTLDSAALVHETFLRLVGNRLPRWQDRAHFYAIAARVMRRVLVDHARLHCAAKRGHGEPAIPLEDETVVLQLERGEQLVALDEALTALAEVDPRKAQVVELRFFGGLTIEEAAEVVGVSTATVVNETRMARLWLHDEMTRR